MTTWEQQSIQQVLTIYAEHPMPGGDVVLLLDNKVCMEWEGLVDEWDADLRDSMARVLRETTRHTLMAIARPGATMLPRDIEVWRDLQKALSGSDVELLPLHALPAA